MDSWFFAFRNLTFGIKFDFKRFHDDAVKLKLLRPNTEKTQCKKLSHKDVNGNARRKKLLSSDDESAVAAKKRKIEIPHEENNETDKKSKLSNKVVNKNNCSDDEEQDGSKDNDNEDNSDDNEEDDSEDDDEDDSVYSYKNKDNDSTDGVADEEEGEDDISDNDTSEGDDEVDEDDENSGKMEMSDEELLENSATEQLQHCEVALRKKKNKKKDKSPAKLAQIKKEQVNHFRNERQMQVYGEDIPDPVFSFEQLAKEYGINETIVDNLKAVGFLTPTSIEAQAIPVMLHRREIMACAPTGSGKTLAFVLPILHHLKEPTKKRNCIRALVLAPTIELAKQIHREFGRVGEGLGFRIKFIEKVAKELTRATKKPKKVDILVTTPNRLVYLMKESSSILSLASVEWLIIDECDKLFEDGKSGFRDQLGAIYKVCNSKDVRRGLFSATFANDVREWCILNLDNVIQVYVGARNAATHVIRQELVYAGDEVGKLMALRELIRQGFQPPVLIFVQSKDRARDLFIELCYDKVNVEVIHGEKTQAQRDKIVADFRSGKIWILICTEVMSRGIDFKGVNLIVNYDFPNSAVSYIHRIGRTGRAGRPGKAVTYFANGDVKYLKCIVNVMREAGCEVPEYMLQLKPPSKSKRKKLARSAVKREPINLQRFLSKKMKKNNSKKKKPSDAVEKATKMD